MAYQTWKQAYTTVLEGRKVSVEVDWEYEDPSNLAVEWEEMGVYVLEYDPRRKKMTIGGEPKELEFWLIDIYGMGRNPAKAAIRSGKKVR